MIPIIEALIGQGFDVRIHDRNVEVSALVGANRDYMLNAIPHIHRLLVSEIEDVFAHAETLVIGHGDPAFETALAAHGAGKRVVDLVRLRQRTAGASEYTGICW
jgi:GDP-mannose 6-dehydrogenase